ncbi:MAG TPA: hypothetical protein ENN81_02380 [Phycisphaerales bacterium]|nr:hypothetical protein [Phycisphaerales bacterium]
MRRGLAVVILWGFLSAVSCGSVWLAADSNMPDPNQEVTVYVHTDTPLYLLSLWAQAVGDANVTAVMGPNDCNQYGWDGGWNIDGYFDSEGWVAMGGVAWPNEANDVVGYFTFTYHGGQVSVSVAAEWSTGFDTDCQPAVFSTAPLLIGEPDPNEWLSGAMGETGEQSEQVVSIGAQEVDTNMADANTLWITAQFRRTIVPPVQLSGPNNSALQEPYARFPGLALEQTPTTGGTMGMALLDGAVSLYEITQSTILDPATVYYVPNPPLYIHSTTSEEIDVVIPSDTMIVVAQNWQSYGIVVCDRANVHFGAPAPTATPPTLPVYPGDVTNPVAPVWIVSEGQYPFFNNRIGLLIERTAGKRSRIENIYLWGFYYAVKVDQQLEAPISNLFITGCYCGITSYGSNLIANCVVDFFGVGNSQWPYWGVAFDFEPTSADQSIQFPNPEYQISNCLANDGDVGYWATGSDEWDVPNYWATDSVAANCFYGYACWNVLGISIVCPGLYNNYQDKNFAEMPFTYAVYETNDPFVGEQNGYRIFLNPDSQFVDAGSFLSPLPGWTTRTDGAPDEGIGDIWPHYQTTGIDLNPRANLNGDTILNMPDLAEFLDQWRVADPSSADFNRDGKLDFADVAVLGEDWLSNSMALVILDLESPAAVEQGNVRGVIGLRFEDIPLTAVLVSVYLDNQPIGELQFGWDTENDWITFDSSAFLNGWHVLRTITTDISGNVTNHTPVPLYFNNLLHGVVAGDHFHPSEDYVYSGFYDGAAILEAQLLDQDDQVIWSSTHEGPHVTIVVPGATFSAEYFCRLVVAETDSGMMAMGEPDASSSDTVTYKDLTKEFKQADWPNGARMVIVMPDTDVYKARKPAIKACAQACADRGVTWVALYYKDVTPQNLTYLFTKPAAKYVYWPGHANSHVGRDVRHGIEGVPRTHALCWKHTERRWRRDKWEKIGAFCRLNWNEPLPDDWDARGFDLWSLGMHDSWNKKIVFHDGCYSAVYWDMAAAYGVFSLQGYGSLDQIYIGWKVPVDTSSERLGEWLLGDTTAGVEMFWERMGRGDSIHQAFNHVGVYGSRPTRESFFGPDALYGDDNDNITFYGHGVVNKNTIRLE